MIVKGHDFPYVTLMGVLAADLSLMPVITARQNGPISCWCRQWEGQEEAVPGEAVIQTYHPEHYSIQAAIRQVMMHFMKKRHVLETSGISAGRN